MPRSTLKTEAPSRRAVTAIAVPIAAAAVAGALTLAAPAQAAGSSPTLPFPTAICGTGKPAPAGGGGPTASASRSASGPASPSTSASPKADASAPAKSGVVKPTAGAPSAKSSPSPSDSGGQAAGAPSGDPSAPPSATASPTSTEGGFWGWLNGVWTFIFGSDTTQTQATPQVVAAEAKTNPQTDTASDANTSPNATPGLGTLLGKLTPSPSSVPAPPSTPALKPSSPAASKPGTAPSTAKSPTPVSTASCVPASEIKKNAASSGGETAAEIPWHLSTPSMTMYNLTYNGITTIKTVDGSMQALDFTASKVTLVSMVTFSHQQGSKLQYVNGGQGKTVTLNNVHLLTTSMTADVLGLLHLTFTPNSPPTALLGLLQGVTVPLPLLFTNVEADNAFLNTGSIVIPGFDGHGN